MVWYGSLITLHTLTNITISCDNLRHVSNLCILPCSYVVVLRVFGKWLYGIYIGHISHCKSMVFHELYDFRECRSRLVLLFYCFLGKCCGDSFNWLCPCLSGGSRLCRIWVHFSWLLYKNAYHQYVGFNQDDTGQVLVHYGTLTGVWL